MPYNIVFGKCIVAKEIGRNKGKAKRHNLFDFDFVQMENFVYGTQATKK